MGVPARGSALAQQAGRAPPGPAAHTRVANDIPCLSTAASTDEIPLHPTPKTNRDSCAHAGSTSPDDLRFTRTQGYAARPYSTGSPRPAGQRAQGRCASSWRQWAPALRRRRTNDGRDHPGRLANPRSRCRRPTGRMRSRKQAAQCVRRATTDASAWRPSPSWVPALHVHRMGRVRHRHRVAARPVRQHGAGAQAGVMQGGDDIVGIAASARQDCKGKRRARDLAPRRQGGRPHARLRPPPRALSRAGGAIRSRLRGTRRADRGRRERGTPAHHRHASGNRGAG